VRRCKTLATTVAGLVLAACLCAGSGIAAEPDPAAVDPSLHTVAATGLHRLIVYRICSPEHCWSKAYLQWFDVESPAGGIAATREIQELNQGTFVDGANWTWRGEKPRLEIRVAQPRGDDPPYRLLVDPGPPGSYTALREPLSGEK